MLFDSSTVGTVQGAKWTCDESQTPAEVRDLRDPSDPFLQRGSGPFEFSGRLLFQHLLFRGRSDCDWCRNSITAGKSGDVTRIQIFFFL